MRYKILFFFLVYLTISCEKEISYTIPQVESKVVLNALITPDSVPVLHVSKSAHIVSNTVPLIDDAKVVLLINNVRTDSLTSGKGGFYKFNSHLVKANKTYKFEVHTKDGKTIFGETVVPFIPKVNLKSFDHSIEFINLEDIVFREIDVSVTIEIDQGDKNEQFYAVYLTSVNKNPYDEGRNKVKGSKSFEEFIEFYNGEAIFEFSGTSSVMKNDKNISILIGDNVGVSSPMYWFSDRSFVSGKQVFSLLFKVFPNDYEIALPSDSVEYNYAINVMSVTKDFYRYVTTAYLSASDPFAESIKIHSNVINGLGVIASRNVVATEFSLKIPK